MNTNRSRITQLNRKHRSAAALLVLLTMLLSTAMVLSSCGVIHQVFSKKVEITFDAAGGVITGDDVKEGKSDSGESLSTYTHKCIVEDPLPDIKAEKKYYKFKGWYTEPEGGIKVAVAAEEMGTLYAQYSSANSNRSVEITDISTGTKGNVVRIDKDEEKNRIKVSFRVSEYYGQRIAFTDKKGKEIKEIKGEAGQDDFAPEGLTLETELPDRKWMDRKTTAYYIRSFGNDHVDKSKPVRFKVTLGGQYEYFDQPIEGSMAWYGGEGETHPSRAGVIIATDDDFVYVRHESTNETEDGSTIYKWKKSDVMINMADVRTDIVYDIYNAYSSRFFPIKGKAMYTNNGGKGLKRYNAISKDAAMHKNSKTGKTTFMVPVQWDFAEKVALAESRARDAGYTLYIVDSFRPMNSVNPVAKAVDDPSLLAYGGTSAHNFGTAVDTGWQRVDQNGKPVGEPYVKNLQALDKKKAAKGPNGNEREIWWQGVNKLPQEWWHYGDNTLNAKFRSHARRIGSLYVNQGECISEKRSKL